MHQNLSLDYPSALKHGYTGSYILASLVRDVEAKKSFYTGSIGTLKAYVTIVYCAYKRCHLRFHVAWLQPVSLQIYGLSAKNLL